MQQRVCAFLVEIVGIPSTMNKQFADSVSVEACAETRNRVRIFRISEFHSGI